MFFWLPCFCPSPLYHLRLTKSATPKIINPTSHHQLTTIIRRTPPLSTTRKLSDSTSPSPNTDSIKRSSTHQSPNLKDLCFFLSSFVSPLYLSFCSLLSLSLYLTLLFFCSQSHHLFSISLSRNPLQSLIDGHRFIKPSHVPI